jgi:signal transduction histidine kinase
MTKLFLKLWLLIIVASLASFQIQKQVFSWSSEANIVNNSNERFRRIYVLIEEVLMPFPKSEWPTRFENMKARVGSPEVFLGPSRMLTLDALEKSGEVNAAGMKKIRTQQPFSLDTANGRGYEIFHTILGTEYVVVLKAPFAISQPMFIMGIFTPTQFTWLTELFVYALAIFLWLRLFRRDILTLEKAANRVGEGSFDFAVNVKKGAALYPVADSFVRMKDKIRGLLQSHKQLTNAISHEFRTPITRLRFRHELAMTATTLAEKNSELIAMDSAIDQLDELSTELLEYARLDREDPKLDVAAIDVAPWLDELVAEAQEVARSTDRMIRVSAHVGIDSVDGDYRYLSRAAANLLRNSVRYAKTEVEIFVYEENGCSILAVEDDGAGIPEAEREHLFEPFSRLDKSRDRASGGFGIGLAIVQQIARWHGGSANIGDAKLGGARVHIKWNCNNKMTTLGSAP